MNESDIQSVRRQSIAELCDAPLDVLVVGGGIVGAGVARDAAMRGLRVGLVDKHDFAFGTSSRSSRLLHGGLRYLAQGRLGLVYESSREKMVLRRIAPHLAEPLGFLFPTYRHTAWPRWKLSIGVKLYDLLCGRQNLGRSRTLDAAEVRQRLPGLHTEDLTGAVVYYDGQTNDARLVLDTLRSAARHGAMVLNYAALEAATPDGALWRCGIRDTLNDTEFEVKARCVINATGPWAAAVPHSQIRLRLTKGVHLVIDGARLPISEAVVMAVGERILFAIPWGERVILGTTDTDYKGSLEDVTADSSDIAYILDIVNRHFLSAALTADDVINSWAGVRPLIAAGQGGPSDISRAHKILMPEPGWFDVAGGKLTTYRLIAEQVIDRVLAYQRVKSMPCRTAAEPLLPAGLDPASSGTLPPPVSKELVEYYCRHEWAMHLDDIMVRRTSWHYYCKDAATIAEQVAGWMGESLGWNAARHMKDIDEYRRLLHSTTGGQNALH